MTLAQFVVIRWCFFDGILPHYKLFETQAKFIVVTEELWVRWDLIQEDLGHLQWALQGGGGGERGGKGQKQRHGVREAKKEKAKTEQRKEREDVREEVFESI